MKKIDCQTLREQLFCGRLPNGMSLFIVPKPGFRQKAGLLTVNFGAIDRCLPVSGTRKNRILPAGVAHFLEHRLFEKAAGDIAERFSALGADVDAETGFTSTVFSFSCTDFFAQNLDLLLELAFCLHLTGQGVEREREIISREIELFADNLESVAYLKALDSIYPGQALGVDIAGTLSSIQGIDQKLLQRCHRTFYHPANARLLLCGDVAVEETCDRLTGWWDTSWTNARTTAVGLERPPMVELDPGSRETSLAIVEPYLLLAFRDRRVGLVGEPLLRRELALELALDLLFGPGSRFVSQHYAEGLIDIDDFGFELHVEPIFAYCLIGGETPSPERLEEAIVGELERAGRQGMKWVDFELVRRKAYGRLLAGFDRIDDCVALMERAVSCGAGPFDYVQAYSQLTIEAIGDCLETCLTPQSYGRSLVRIDSR